MSYSLILLNTYDLADYCLFLMNNYSELENINIKASKEININDLALLIKDKIGCDGALKFDTSNSDYSLRKLMNNSRIHALGWEPAITLDEGLERTIMEYKSSLSTISQ